MALDTMFNPKAFSPETTLKFDIGTVDTRIFVNDVSVFPAVPTLATIGTDALEAETVQITAIGSDFIDVVRGVSGTAGEHTANTIIARNFAAKDQEVIQENITKLNNEKVPFADTLTEMAAVDDENDLLVVEDVSPTTKVNKKLKLSALFAYIRTLFFGTISGIVKANGTGGLAFAESNVDYAVPPKVFASKVVATGDWATDATIATHTKRATITCAGVTSDMFILVTFGQPELETDNYSGEANAGTGVVYIYARATPAASITVKTITAFKVAS
jgi:hypothetical protein